MSFYPQASAPVQFLLNSFPVYEFDTISGIIKTRLNRRRPFNYKASANLVLF